MTLGEQSITFLDSSTDDIETVNINNSSSIISDGSNGGGGGGGSAMPETLFEEKNINAEAKTEKIFHKIYHREPERSNNKYDDNAIMVMTYGLRLPNRNMDSEAAAIKSFKNIFDYEPNNARN